MSGLGRSVGSFNLIFIFYIFADRSRCRRKGKTEATVLQEKGRGDLKRAFPLKPILFCVYFILKKFVQVNVCQKAHQHSYKQTKGDSLLFCSTVSYFVGKPISKKNEKQTKTKKTLSPESKQDVLRKYFVCGQQIKIISQVARIVFPGPAKAMRSLMRFCKIIIAREPITYGLLSLRAF